MLTKISLILLLSFSLCLAVRPKLRSDAIFRPVQLIQMMKNQLPYLDNPAFGWNGLNILDAAESDELNAFAQTLAEQTTNPIDFINSYTKTDENVLTFGFRLNGSTTIKALLLNDSSVIVDHMSGFLDFRNNGVRLSMLATEIRDSIRTARCFTPQNYSPKNCSWTKQAGTISVSSESFNFNTNLRSLRDLINVFSMYDSYLESQIKLMTANGTIPLGYKPFTLKMNFKNFVLDLVSTRRVDRPLVVEPTMEHDELLEVIDFHFKQMVDDSTLEAFELPKRMDRYGFGFAVDALGNLNIVYSFGGKVKQPETPKKTLNDYYNMMNLYVTPKGNKLNFTFDQETPFVDLLRRNSRLMADAVNLDRINNNIRPISENDPELFRLATQEAQRMAREGKLSAPLFTGVERKTIILAMKYIGSTTVRDFIVDSTKVVDVGSIACFDSFTKTQAKIWGILENMGNLCSPAASEAWKRFDATGNGIAYSDNGDVYITVALADTF